MDDEQIFEAFLGRIITDHQGNPYADGINQVTEHLCMTFQELTDITDETVEAFKKNHNERNRTMGTGNAININDKVYTAIMSVLFEMRDRVQCGALPSVDMLNGIDARTLITLCTNRNDGCPLH